MSNSHTMLTLSKMKSLTLLVLVSCTTCTPIQQEKSHVTRQSGVGIVTGATSRDENGNVYVRREVRDLMDNYPEQWSLYIMALDRLHHAPQSDPYSFYGLASIHGRPYQTWGDAPGLPYKIDKAGYCPHDNELFLGWHRPYLALFEQVVSSYVHDIASKAPADQLQRYLAAADEFRIPYWDWAKGTKTGQVPDSLIAPFMMVRDFSDAPVVLNNPLHSYHFDTMPEGFHGKWRYINTTVRWPHSDDPWAPTQIFKFPEAFRNQSNNLIAQTGIAFRSSSFSRFSSALEDVHGWVHGIIGGGYSRDSPSWGHMWPLEYSAYEPLFMLHHANVDRLFSLYQAAHPDRWMETSSIGNQGNVFLEDNQEISADTELLPFRKTPGKFWTTNDCRDTTVLGYAYPETQRWNFESDEEYQSHATSVIAKIYSGRLRNQVAAAQLSAFGQSLSENNNVFTDWTIETHTTASRFPGTFRVEFSLIGLFQSDDVVDVGSWMVLVPEHRKDTTDTTSGAGSERVLNGTTSMTEHLIDRVNKGVLDSLRPEHVVPYLKDALTWNVFDSDGHRIPQPQGDELTVTVFSTEARVPKDADQAIEFSAERTPYPEVTIDKFWDVDVLPPEE